MDLLFDIQLAFSWVQLSSVQPVTVHAGVFSIRHYSLNANTAAASLSQHFKQPPSAGTTQSTLAWLGRSVHHIV